MSGDKAMAESRMIRVLLAAAMVLATVRSHASGGGCLGEERRGVSRLPRSGTAEVVATGVLDGDTFVAFIDGAPRRVRLSRIDAPEKRQAFGHRAEHALRELVWKHKVHIRWDRLDRNCRPIADVTVDGLDVSEALLRAGMAWQYTAYSRDAKLEAIELEARRNHTGLWSEPGPVPPWEWRREHEKPSGESGRR